jgi:asparagine synthase (glutamine-hydrolysing)
MAAALAHRGPDGEGLFLSGEIAMSHRRLRILDLSDEGRQPMKSPDGRFTMVFNGELFNYVELKAELGGEFRSTGDTEVLLEACARWGVERALARTVGMFAFALWDEALETLTLARDRVGEKPLVYFWDGRVLAFASELKALEPFHEKRLDAPALDAYLALGYIPAPLSIFRGTRKLPAGHLAEYKGGRLAVRRWWFPERAASGVAHKREDRMEQLRELVGSAVRVRLRSDVPVAVCLSGGIDSSIVAAECARKGANLEAYTVELDGDRTDLPFARSMAQQLGFAHQIIEARSSSAASQLEEASRCYDEPFGDSSALPTLTLARALSSRYKVVLTGDGGDEAFAGYPHYERIGTKQFLKAAAAGAGFLDGRGSTGVYVQSKSLFDQSARNRLLGGSSTSNTLAYFLASDRYLRQASGSTLHRALWTDRHLYLANDLTYKTDMALSAYSIEGRAPLLDHRLLEWSQQLEEADLVCGREKKVLLRDAYRGDLPGEILDRPKHGFGAPIGQWLDHGLKEFAGDLLPCRLLETVPQKKLSGQRLWTVLAFAAWAREWQATW